jgi:deoxyhypusine synthase
MPSEDLPEDAVHIKGPDLSNPITLEELLKSYNTIGFQATGLSRAVQIVEEMVNPPIHMWAKLICRGNAVQILISL